MEPDIILGRSFMEHTRSMINYQLGEITLWSEIDEEIKKVTNNIQDKEEEFLVLQKFLLTPKGSHIVPTSWVTSCHQSILLPKTPT